ncbi:cation transporter [Candidatus Bipolaricaulota bacterium]|nr:cation transporter [Candidatus Bipolaricaulota bacterium]TFH11166.1 MAG: cation transporter [Candidatus Atribacteria bacterium]
MAAESATMRGGDHDLSHSHSHHGHSHGPSAGRRIGVAFFLNLAFAILEIVGGIWTNSMAVLADALHDLGDSLALALTWRFAKVAEKKGDSSYTFGYRRFSLIGALVMAMTLIAGGLFVLVRAIPRVIDPEPSNAQGMIILAVVGVLVNGFAAMRMHGGKSLSERVVTWHFVEDVLGWIVVLIAAIVMRIWNIHVIDPILSILITLYVLWNIAKQLKETLVILLQGVPHGLSIELVESEIAKIEGVMGVHHTHVWTQDGEHHVLSTHVLCDPDFSIQQSAQLRAIVKSRLAQMSIPHATIEMEPALGGDCPDACENCFNA